MNEVEEYISKGYWGNQVLGDVFDHTVRDYPDRIALAQGERRISYREFGKAVDRLSLKLLEMGVGKGDFVIVLLPNCPEYAFFHYAVAKIGAVGVPMVHTQKVNEIRYVVDLFE
ncbi:MAG: AMP-binding protein, partial [Candidatus Poseidoniia archaeon]|nr:AMP-binding protein [Candidatus Poseidoniia archaeon]